MFQAHVEGCGSSIGELTDILQISNDLTNMAKYLKTSIAQIYHSSHSIYRLCIIMETLLTASDLKSDNNCLEICGRRRMCYKSDALMGMNLEMQLLCSTFKRAVSILKHSRRSRAS